MGAVRWSSAVLLFVLTSVTFPLHAAVHAKWRVSVGGGNVEHYQTSQQACQRQHDAWAPENPGPVTAAPYKGSFIHHQCDWLDHTDGPYKLNPLPGTVALYCVDENNQLASGYQLEPPGICVPSN